MFRQKTKQKQTYPNHAQINVLLTKYFDNIIHIQKTYSGKQNEFEKKFYSIK